jgi:hypothetical protein
LCSFGTFAQTTRLDGNLDIDSTEKPFGQFIIYNAADSTLIKGSYIDSAYFSIEFDRKELTNCYIKINLAGYLDTIIHFDASSPTVSLGTIALRSDKTLSVVDVVYKKPEFQRTIDGIKINVQGTTLQTLTNLYEVLVASPKLASPDGESIEIIGKGSPLILIDRQAIISNDELKAIPANMIESIEIITNPSAKYKAQGSGNGVVEVFTKNFTLEGYNGTLNTSVGINTELKPFANMSLGLNYKRKKLSISGNLSSNYVLSNSFSTSDGHSTDDSHQSIQSNAINDFLSAGGSYQFKAAYLFSPGQKLTFGLRGNENYGSSKSSSETTYSRNDSILTSKTSLSTPSNNSLNNTAFVNYSVQTDTNKSVFEVNLNFVRKSSWNNTTTSSTYFNEALATNSAYDIKNESSEQPLIGEFRVSYDHVFDTSGWKWGVGGTYNVLVNGKTYDQYNLVLTDWVVDPIYSNSYDYREQIGSLYTELSKRWKKMSFRGGVRGEYTELNGYSHSLEKQFMDSVYILPFPSASVMLEPNEKVALTFSYNSGIQRPQFSNYDPFIRIQDSLSISYGNPYLRPKTSHSWAFDLDLFYAYNFSVTYSRAKNPQSDLIFVDDSTFLWNSTPWNAESEQSLTGSFNIPLQLKLLSGWNSVWMSYKKHTFTPEFNRAPFFNLTYGLYSYITLNLPKEFSVLNSIHLMKWGSANFVGNTQVNWGLRLTKKFMKGNFQLFGEVTNIIPPRQNYLRYFSNFEYDDRSQAQFTTFKLGLFCKFGRLKQSTNIKESESGQSERL